MDEQSQDRKDQSEEDLELLKANQQLSRMREVYDNKQIRRGRRVENGLENLLKSLQKQAKKLQRHPITEWYEVWAKVVGPEISAQTKVKDLKNGFLRIEVNNAVLRTELEAFYSADLLTALQEEKSNVLLRGIKFILGKDK